MGTTTTTTTTTTNYYHHPLPPDSFIKIAGSLPGVDWELIGSLPGSLLPEGGIDGLCRGWEPVPRGGRVDTCGSTWPAPPLTPSSHPFTPSPPSPSTQRLFQYYYQFSSLSFFSVSVCFCFVSFFGNFFTGKIGWK